ncbi:non-specific lipid transfer protein GPI-anchored 20-like [Impatiens glandulifera]|uniref:non-specific lipid transfer protein GPI-anchored 20-like n=1 Tax=Impatiens glandulifera TaxID=253017 RepID=UPI001FB13FE1|nr:non-specific lipid transfer protein GPI-anchored 20-like [Impatiens glandulifera]
MAKSLSFVVTIMSIMILLTNGQIQSPCTPSMIGTLTPCLNFLTNSTANGGTSPTATCCNQLKTLMGYGKDCLCLIVTGGVPFQIPINRISAISLPRVCNMPGVPIQCKASAAPIPAPGPSAFVPAMSPDQESPSLSPEASTSDPTQISPSTTDQPEVDTPPTSSPRVRPVANPSDSAANPSHTRTHYFVMSTFVVIIMLLKP